MVIQNWFREFDGEHGFSAGLPFVRATNNLRGILRTQSKCSGILNERYPKQQ
jgi:hypothetical protein